MPANVLQIQYKHILRILFFCAVLLIAASLAGQIAVHQGGVEAGRLITLFDLSRERNIPTFFTVFLMMAIAFTLSIPAALNAGGRGRDASKWALLAAGFLAMAYDEAFQVHELFIGPVRNLLGSENLGVFHYAWVIPAFGLVLGLGLFFLGFLRRLPSATRRVFLAAAALYLGGGLGVEVIGGSYDASHGYDNLTYHLISTVEESLEIAGLIVFLFGLINYLRDTYGEIRMGFAAPSE